MAGSSAHKPGGSSELLAFFLEGQVEAGALLGGLFLMLSSWLFDVVVSRTDVRTSGTCPPRPGQALSIFVPLAILFRTPLGRPSAAAVRSWASASCVQRSFRVGRIIIIISSIVRLLLLLLLLLLGALVALDISPVATLHVDDGALRA